MLINELEWYKPIKNILVSKKNNNVNLEKRTNTEVEAVMSLVEVKRQRNAVEARKAAALERIATALEAKLIK